MDGPTWRWRTLTRALSSVLLGTGDATFGARSDFGTGFGPVSVAIGDLNRDGRPDLAVGDYTSRTVSVLLGNGDGAFGAQRSEEHTSELQSRLHLVCRLLLEKKKKTKVDTALEARL